VAKHIFQACLVRIYTQSNIKTSLYVYIPGFCSKKMITIKSHFSTNIKCYVFSYYPTSSWAYRAEGAAAPQFVGQTKPVGQYSLHSRAILTYYKNKWDKFCQFCGKFCQSCWKLCYLIGIFVITPPPPLGKISFRPPNFFLPVRPCTSLISNHCNQPRQGLTV
jgi:hypothetical protein